MLVWTKKAEGDFRRKYPGRTCERIAGQAATWEGKALRKGSSVALGYRERGWVAEVPDPMPEVNRIDMRGRNRRANDWSTGVHGYDESVKKERWERLRFWFAQKNIKSLRQVALNMGFQRSNALTLFAKKYGQEMAERYGKLPNLSRRTPRQLSVIWTRIMED